ncbi:MAG: 50S ribosomal protein L4 [Clostridia bacterium]|nr:50S ribosomal protein L4 [Clostridia bacterium]
MPKVKVYNQNAEASGTMTLKDEVFGVEYKEALIHDVVVAYLANQRQGNKSTLTRSEVRGHHKKPWAQKHTGRARHGDTKAPQFTGGGVVFAPKPRDYSLKVNAKAKKIAFKSALSQKLAQNELVVLDKVELEAPKTKYAQALLDAFKYTKPTLLVVSGDNADLLRASANIQNLLVVDAKLANTYEVVASTNVLMTKDAVKAIEEAYTK